MTWDRRGFDRADANDDSDSYDGYERYRGYASDGADDDAEGGVGRSGGRRRRLVTPTRVTIAVALIGSLAYLVYAISVRDTRQIPLLASGAGVLGIVFALLAVAGGVSTFRAGRDGHFLRALGMAIAGGVAGMIAAGALAFAFVLALAYNS